MTPPAGTGPADLLLPPRTRLVYVGPPKTGTTSLQTAAQVLRKELFAHGVLYPGTRRNHRREVYALIERIDSKSSHPGTAAQRAGMTRNDLNRVPDHALWDLLMAEVAGAPDHRVLISHEGAGSATVEQARRFPEALGADRTHIAITLRPRSAVLASAWIERLKNGESETFEQWLERANGRGGRRLPEVTLRHLDQGGLVQTWVEAVGAENVTVIIVDSKRKELLTSAFEQMLGLPERMLTDVELGGLASNRSLTAPEAELLREVNAAVYRRNKTSWPAYLQVITNGTVARMMSHRVPASGEARVRLPQWAADLAVADGKRYAAQIEASGARVVGDLERLYAAPAVAEADDAPAVIDMAIAVEAVAGALLGAQHLERAVRRTSKPVKKSTAAAAHAVEAPKAVTASVKQRLAVLLRRVKGRLRTLLRRP